MTIEVALLISGISVAFAIFFGIANVKRNQRIDTKNEASELTTVIVKLENISTGITEIKSELSNVKNDVKQDRADIIRIDESLKSAWRRINIMEKLLGKGHGDEDA